MSLDTRPMTLPTDPPTDTDAFPENPMTITMTTPTDSTPTDATPTDRTAASGRVKLHNIVRGEWIKFWSVRSTSITLVAAAIATIGFGMIFSATVGSNEAPGPSFGLTDPITVATGAINLTQMIVGVLGVIVVATEYSTGLIRTTFAAVGRRTGVLQGKAIVLGMSTLAVSAIGVLGALWAGQLVYAGPQDTVGFTDPDLWTVAAGTTIYLAGIALIGLALGFIFRSTSGAIGVLFGGVFIGPGLLSLLPDGFTDLVLKYLPSEAGSAMMSRVADPDLLSRGPAYAVFGAWVFGLLAIAAVTLKVRDA